MTFETVRLSDVADIIVGFAFKSQDFNTNANGIRLVRGKNITKRSLRWGDDTRWWNDLTLDLEKYYLILSISLYTIFSKNTSFFETVAIFTERSGVNIATVSVK